MIKSVSVLGLNAIFFNDAGKQVFYAKQILKWFKN